MKWIRDVKQAYQQEQERYRQFKEVQKLIKQFMGIFGALEQNTTKQSDEPAQGLKPADFFDLKGVKDVTESVKK